jgi:hypothetical protein
VCVEEKEDGCVVFGLRGRCGEASFLFYALSSGPAGPAMLALEARLNDTNCLLLISAKQTSHQLCQSLC